MYNTPLFQCYAHQSIEGAKIMACILVFMGISFYVTYIIRLLSYLKLEFQVRLTYMFC